MVVDVAAAGGRLIAAARPSGAIHALTAGRPGVYISAGARHGSPRQPLYAPRTKQVPLFHADTPGGVIQRIQPNDGFATGDRAERYWLTRESQRR